jgi:hypothetical protein
MSRRVTAALFLGYLLFAASGNAQPPATEQVKSRPATLEGIVVDALTGSPVEGVEILARGPERLQARTGSDGRFVFNAVPAGKYRVFPQKSGYALGFSRQVTAAPGEHITGIALKAPPEGVISGVVLNSSKQPVASAPVIAYRQMYRARRFEYVTRASALTNDLGEFRLGNLEPGKYVVSVAPVTPGPSRKKIARKQNGGDAPSLPREVPLFYPNAFDIDGAAPVYVSAGEKRDGVDFLMRKVPTYCVSAILQGAGTDDKSILAVVAQIGLGWNKMVGAGEIPASEFEFCGLTPGSYALWLTRKNSYGGADQFSGTPFSISKRDVDLGPLSLQSGSAVSGRVSFTEADRDATMPKHVTLSLSAVNRISFMGEKGSAQSHPDGSFRFDNVFADEYWFEAWTSAAGYYVQSATCAGRDALSAPIRAGECDLGVVLGAHGPSVSGQVLNKENDPVSDATVVLMARRSSNPVAGLAVFTRETDQNGRFEFRSGLAPGEYRAIALTGVRYSDGEAFNPVLGREYWSKATELSVARGEDKALTLNPVACDLCGGR